MKHRYTWTTEKATLIYPYTIDHVAKAVLDPELLKHVPDAVLRRFRFDLDLDQQALVDAELVSRELSGVYVADLNEALDAVKRMINDHIDSKFCDL